MCSIYYQLQDTLKTVVNMSKTKSTIKRNVLEVLDMNSYVL